MSTLTETRCPNCHIVFGVPGDFLETRQADKRNFWCPNGHNMSYTESEADRLRRERNRLQQQLAQKDDEIADERRRTAAGVKKIKRLERRAKGGTCPCCQRSFSNMAQHMKTQHPAFGVEKPQLKVVA